MLEEQKEYIDLSVYATEIGTEIWISDDEGNLVQKGIGMVKTSLAPGKYKVRFGLDGDDKEIELKSQTTVRVVED